ncbi:MAG TPA: acyl carrier protein [Gaiellaceae bacterium]|nr:acyl carrier protein [Gaiellaceae bacterium]
MQADGRPDAIEQRARELATQLALLTGVDVTELPDGVATPLRTIEIDSLVLIDFLARTERTFGYAWDEETPPEVFESLLTIANEMLVTSTGTVAGGAAT